MTHISFSSLFRKITWGKKTDWVGKKLTSQIFPRGKKLTGQFFPGKEWAAHSFPGKKLTGKNWPLHRYRTPRQCLFGKFSCRSSRFFSLYWGTRQFTDTFFEDSSPTHLINGYLAYLFFLSLYTARPWRGFFRVLSAGVLCTYRVAGRKPTSNHIKITVGFFNLHKGWLSLHRGHPVNVPIRRTMHLSSVIPANDTRESMFGHRNFPRREQGSNLGPLAPEASEASA